MKWPFNLKKVKIIKQDMHNNSKTIKRNSRNHASNEFIQRNKLKEVYSNSWSQYRPRVSPKFFYDFFFLLHLVRLLYDKLIIWQVLLLHMAIVYWFV